MSSNRLVGMDTGAAYNHNKAAKQKKRGKPPPPPGSESVRSTFHRLLSLVLYC